jgi:tRNA(adenine34) deaminase
MVLEKTPATGSAAAHSDGLLHARFMQEALREAREAAAQGEVPVGAVVVLGGAVIGRGRNGPVARHDPTAHAEVLALREAAQHLGNYRLEDCTLYVTLEPCAMCGGAMLQARVKRVVYGAAEPKTGAAGSVLDVFGYPQINHQTEVVRGVLEAECAALMGDFFRRRRQENKARDRVLEPHPLKDTALRSGAKAFANLPHWPWQPQWRSDLPALAGLRMAVVDEGPKDAATTWLCLHGSPAWGYAFRHEMAVWAASGHRIVVPDLPGFGRSDRPKRDKAHSAAWHAQVLAELVQALDLREAVLVGQGDGARLGLAVAERMPQRFRGAWLVDAWPQAAQPEKRRQWFEQAARKPSWNVGGALQAQESVAGCAAAEQQAWNAPFAEPGHRAALKAWPRVQAELPAVPAQLLAQWAERHGLWLQPGTSGKLVAEKDWQDAWLQAVPQLAQHAEVWQLNQSAAAVPAAAQDRARSAVEYFAA